MFNIKEIKTQKKLINFSVFIIISVAVTFSIWFLYENFYNTINWKNQASTGLNQRAAIKHVNLDKMRKATKEVKNNINGTSSEEFNINIDFR